MKVENFDFFAKKIQTFSKKFENLTFAPSPGLENYDFMRKKNEREREIEMFGDNTIFKSLQKWILNF